MNSDGGNSFFNNGFIGFVFISVFCALVVYVVISANKQRRAKYRRVLNDIRSEDALASIAREQEHYGKGRTVLTELDYYHLCLVEELLNVAHPLTKGIRFGFLESFSDATPTNLDTMRNELHQLMAVLEKLGDEIGDWDRAKIDQHKKSMEHYLKYAKRRGRIVTSPADAAGWLEDDKEVVQADREFGSLPHTQPPREYADYTDLVSGIQVHSTLTVDKVKSVLDSFGLITLKEQMTQYGTAEQVLSLFNVRRALQEGEVNEVVVTYDGKTPEQIEIG